MANNNDLDPEEIAERLRQQQQESEKDAQWLMTEEKNLVSLHVGLSMSFVQYTGLKLKSVYQKNYFSYFSTKAYVEYVWYSKEPFH